MVVDESFSTRDREAVEAAVREGEGRTSGEIVPVAVGRSADYPQAGWTAALLGALAVALLAAALLHLGVVWTSAPALWVAAMALGGAAAGYLLVRVAPALERSLVSDEAMDDAVAARAYRAFVDHEVFATRDRTGIVILVSLFERKVVILADAGINARVEQHEWDSVTAEIAAGIRAGTPGAALADGIRQCGVLLQRGGVERRPDDTDELPDHLRIEER